MDELRDIPPNVLSFLDKAADLHAEIQRDLFSQNMFAEFQDHTKSPIEDMFLVAVNMLVGARYEDVSPDPYTVDSGETFVGPGLHMACQRQIGKYRVDFLIQYYGPRNRLVGPPVVVELDGHDFHDKDKRKRAYEKGRDRFLVKNGYSVLHFTGSEVVADPYRVAHEALEIANYLRFEYDPKDPVGINQ